MDIVLAGNLQSFARVYLDDIIVHGKTAEEHVTHVQMVLQAFRASGLRANPCKCNFAASEVVYLGHVIC